jgi:hypothetical protein
VSTRHKPTSSAQPNHPDPATPSAKEKVFLLLFLQKKKNPFQKIAPTHYQN